LPVLLHRRKSAPAGPARAKSTMPANSGYRPSMSRRGIQNRALLQPRGRVSLKASCGVNEEGTNVIDMRKSRVRAREVRRPKKWLDLVVGEKGGRIEAKRSAADRPAVRACGSGMVGLTASAGSIAPPNPMACCAADAYLLATISPYRIAAMALD